jgi:arginine utilization protein RocB
VREIAESLIAIPSVSPDVEAETRCARALESALPDRVEKGVWPTPDGRPVVWALAPGASPRTIVLLGHYDTVGFDVAGAIGSDVPFAEPFDSKFRRDVLEATLLSDVHGTTELRRDVEEERRQPGTWMFGRGALDMKSGLAAGIAVLHERASRTGPAAGGVLFIATPDEEHLSLGMRTATRALPSFRDARGLELLGVVNLDYCLEPCVYLGVAGKIQLGVYVLGEPGHVADPGRGSNALELAARVITALTSSATAADSAATHAPPAVLKLDDLKTRYSIEPPLEALVEFSVPWIEGPLEERMATCRGIVERSLASALAPGIGSNASNTRVVMAPELVGFGEHQILLAEGADARARNLARLRGRCRSAGVHGPAIVLHLLPPFYPPAPGGSGAFTRAVQHWAEGERVPVRGRYPFISDASYVAWPNETARSIERYLWSLGADYPLPIDEARALNLEVVNVGPWGRDAHRPYERVNVAYAFERPPGMIARLVDTILDV